MENWAEVQRLFHREGLTKAAIARRLGMSRTTVIRLLRLREPPRYVRPAAGSQLDPYRAEIRSLLAVDPTAAATVICEREDGTCGHRWTPPAAPGPGGACIDSYLRNSNSCLMYGIAVRRKGSGVRPTFLPNW